MIGICKQGSMTNGRKNKKDSGPPQNLVGEVLERKAGFSQS